jgi:hypothetical protein
MTAALFNRGEDGACAASPELSVEHARPSDVRLRMPADLIELLNELPLAQREKILSDPVDNSHFELFRDACAMTRAGLPAEVQLRVLAVRFENYHKTISETDVEKAVCDASLKAHAIRPRRYPAPSYEARKEVIACFPDALERLRAESPVHNPGALMCSEIIDRLFTDRDLVCMAQSKYESRTEQRTAFRSRERNHQFIVVNPMAARLGMTQQGKLSTRCLENAGPRTRIVIEYDNGSLDEQAALHLHLRALGVNLVMAVFSGSKSLHGWFDVTNESDESVMKTFRYAAYLGADTATFCPVQLVRTPNAVRDNGTLQRVEFLSLK